MYVKERLHYHNDGKRKFDSHEFYIREPYVCGFGGSKEEAYAEFMTRLDEYVVSIQNFKKRVRMDMGIKVDCFGKAI